MFFNLSACLLTGVYYVVKSNEIQRLMRFRISGDLLFGLGWRFAVAGLITDQAGRKFFVNFEKLNKQKIADNEVKKIMRFMPNAKPYIPYHRKPNSYFFVK